MPHVVTGLSERRASRCGNSPGLRISGCGVKLVLSTKNDKRKNFFQKSNKLVRKRDAGWKVSRCYKSAPWNDARSKRWKPPVGSSVTNGRTHARLVAHIQYKARKKEQDHKNWWDISTKPEMAQKNGSFGKRIAIVTVSARNILELRHQTNFHNYSASLVRLRSDLRWRHARSTESK